MRKYYIYNRPFLFLVLIVNDIVSLYRTWTTLQDYDSSKVLNSLSKSDSHTEAQSSLQYSRFLDRFFMGHAGL